METKIAGILSIFAALVFLTIWLVLMFVAQPEFLSTYETSKKTIIYALTESNSKFFIFSLISISLCLIYTVILFKKKYAQEAMYVILAHTLVAIFVYDWPLVLIVALPLIFFNKVKANA